MKPPAEKTLVVRFSSIGDILLSSLLLRVFRRRFPDCRLDYLVKSEYAELVRHSPHLTGVIEFPRDGSFAELRRFREQINAAGYSLIIDIHDSLRSRYLALGHPNVVRVNKRKLARALLVNIGINLYPSLGGAPGVAERYLETVATLGVKDDGKGLEVFFPEETVEEVHPFLEASSGRRHVVGIAPSAMHWNKIWPAERFAEAGAQLAGEHDAAIILFGSAADRAICGAIEAMMSNRAPQVRIVNVAGKTTLLQAAALMDTCAVVITNDSGLMHLAAARKRRVVAIFGPTVREFGFFPYGTESIVLENAGLSCRPCTHIGLDHCPKQHFACMKEITPSMVIAAARKLL